MSLRIRKVLGSDFYYRTIVEAEDGKVYRDEWDPLTKISHWVRVTRR